MHYRLLQINIERGKQMPKILNYLQDNNFDFIHLQEVQGGELTYSSPSNDNFTDLKNSLSNYNGEIVINTHLKNDKNSYGGNAIFYKSDYELKDRNEIWMHPFKITESRIEDDNTNYLNSPYSALALELLVNKHPLHLITGHFLWGPKPIDTAETIRRAALVKDYLEKLETPFILTGDFNVEANTQTAKQFETLGRNLTREYKITNTLNPNLHRCKHIFPKGVACDLVFTHPQIQVKKYELVTQDLSDHYGLFLEFEIMNETK